MVEKIQKVEFENYLHIHGQSAIVPKNNYGTRKVTINRDLSSEI